MFNAYSRAFWRRILIFCVLKGILCNRWDPLPEDVRSVVSSNHLGEGTPFVFAEYHALLPDFRGDYGVKSELVEAATREPVYQGSNTFLLPLYIPQGAIPLSINERSTRSGKPDSLPNMRVMRGPLPSVSDTDGLINRSVTRRILLTGRRLPTDTRPNPTPPPSFLRSWGKREPSESAETQDYVEEAKLSKQRVLSKRRLEASTRATGNVSTTAAPSSITGENRKPHNDSGSKEATRIKKIMTRLDNQSPIRLNITEAINTTAFPPSSTTSSTSTEMTDFKRITTTDSPVSKEINHSEGGLKSKNRPQNSKEKSAENSHLNASNFHKESNFTPENYAANISASKPSPPTTTLGTTEASEVKRTPKPVKHMTKPPETTTGLPVTKDHQPEEIVKSRMKPVVPSTSKFKNNNEGSSTSPGVSVTTASSPTTVTPTIVLNETTTLSVNKTQNKSPSWLLRRRATLMKEMNLRKEKQKPQESKETDVIEKEGEGVTDVIQKEEEGVTDVIQNEEEGFTDEDSESIIDRVLNSANQNSRFNLHTSQSDNNEANDINSPDETVSDRPRNTIFTKQSTTTPTSTPHTVSSTPKFTFEVPTARQRLPIRTRRPVVSNPLVSSTTPLSFFLLNENKNLITPFEEVRGEESVRTSTPKISSYYPPPSPVPNDDPFEPIMKDISFQLPKTFEPIAKDVSFLAPKTYPTPPARILEKIFPGKMKSPQDIVLEKLSELMKNATEGKKDNLKDIAHEIEKLNEELASMGIHIIDAEFDGQKIKLRDQLKSNSTGTNFSGATTIRYLIPNSKSRSKTHRESMENVKRNIEVGDTNSHFNGLSNLTLIMPTERSYFTLTHSDSPSNRRVTSLGTKVPQLVDKNLNVASATLSPTVQPTLSSEELGEMSTTVASATETPLIDLKDHTKRERNTSEYVHIQRSPSSVSATKVNPTAHSRPNSQQVNSTIKSFKDIYITVTSGSALPSTPPPRVANHSKATKVTYDKTLNDKLNNPLILLITEAENALDKEIEDSGSYIYFIGLLGVIPCVAALVFLYRQRHKKEMKSLPQREERAEGLTPPINHPRPVGHNDTLDAFPGYVFQESEARESPWELPRSKLRITSVIGEGNFGMVWKAEARHLCDWEEDGGPTVLVAVKGVKEGAGTKEKTDLLRELTIMQLLGQHNNIVTLLGCCTKQEPFYLVMEFVMFGKLLEFLREQRSKNNYFNFSSDSEHLTSRDLTKFAFQIATGCEYMQSRGIIHRDLAARNILLDHNKICKIADFGLARSVKDMDNDIYEQKSKGPLPIRWMAPESLYMNIFTHKSDVWSFGILCWEIVTLGSTPYPGISAREVMRRVREGYRLERPEHCRSEFYRIVSKCWHQEISKRSSFSTVKEELRELLDNPSGWVDLENFQEATYYSMHQNNEEKL